MQAVVRDIHFDILLQTVTLTPNKLYPDTIYLFRCYHCGTGISKIQGDIVSVIAGKVPSTQVAVVTQCHVCKENYTFQTIQVYKKTEAVKLILAPQPGLTTSTFKCVICRTSLAHYNKDTVRLLNPMRNMRLPSPLTCTNETCGKEYLLTDIVSMVE